MERLNLKWVFVSSVCALLVIPLLLFWVGYSFNTFRFYTYPKPYLDDYNLPVIISFACFAAAAPVLARIKPKLVILPVTMVVLSQTVYWFFKRYQEWTRLGIKYETDVFAIGYILLLILFIITVTGFIKSVLPIRIASLTVIGVSVFLKVYEIITIFIEGPSGYQVQPDSPMEPTSMLLYDNIRITAILRMILFSLSMLFLALSFPKPGQRRPDLAE